MKHIYSLSALLLLVFCLQCKKESEDFFPLITLNCITDKTVYSSTDFTAVEYEEPAKPYTNCPEGGLQMKRIAGPATGALFPKGRTVVTYEVSDACGNTKTCSFSVTVNNTGGGTGGGNTGGNTGGGGNTGNNCVCAIDSPEKVPYLPLGPGTKLAFHDETGLLHDTLEIEFMNFTPVSYYQMGSWCTCRIDWGIKTKWTNTAGTPLKLTGSFTGYAGAPEYIIRCTPDDFAAQTLFWDPYFGAGNGRVFTLASYDFAGKNFSNVLLARCGEPGDSGYAADKCVCPYISKLIFSETNGLVGYETATGKWLLD